MIIDVTFNGYRLDVRTGGRFAAEITRTNNSAVLHEGLYSAVDTAAVRNPLRDLWDTWGQPAAQSRSSCPPLVATLRDTHLYALQSIPPVLYTPLHSPYLYDFHQNSLFGIQVEQGFFRCFDGSRARTSQFNLSVRYAAPWMHTARLELGQREVAGSRANPRILEYFRASRFWGTDDSGAANAWCASFVAWVMQQNGHTPPANAFRARAWENFGRVLAQPVYGAIGIKSRTGGGHVAFVVGQSSDGRHLYMLGGNQSDEVNVSRYPADVWNTFVVPTDYDSSNDSLPIYQRAAAAAGSEE